MKCDLHVHTVHSGMCTVPVLNRICRESYSEPRHVYETLKSRGMDLVTVTGSRFDRCGGKPARPLRLQRCRDDLHSLTAYLNERRLIYSVNHVFLSLTGRRTEIDSDEFAAIFPAIETLNRQMLGTANRYAGAFAARNRKVIVAGSDAHTLGPLGRTYTEVPQARDRRWSESRRLSSGGALLRRRTPEVVPGPRPRKPGRIRRNGGNRPRPAASKTLCAYARSPAYKKQINPILVRLETLSSPFFDRRRVKTG